MPPAHRDVIDFRSERGRHARFVGREGELAALDACLVGPGAARGWVLVTGQPGMGKSALLARWLDLAERAGRCAAHHFVRRGVADWDRPEAISRSLAAQVEQLYPAQADPEATAARRLLDLLGRVSREVLVPRGERLVLVADGLDEAAAEPGQNPLPLFLPYALPEGVMALCGSRPTYPHLGWLEGRDAFLLRVDLDAATWSASNDTVCRALWSEWAPSFRPRLDAGFVDRALAAGAGNVLYAVKLREQLNVTRRVTALPRGLEGLLEQTWADLRRLPRERRETAISGLGVLCAAREALPLSALEAAAGWTGGDAREDFLEAVRPFLLEDPAAWAGEAAFRPYHESFAALVREKVGADRMRKHHRRLLATAAAWPATEGDDFCRRYALKHAVWHAVAAGEKDRAGALCRDVAFLEGWCREGGVEALEEGLREAAEALGDEEVRLLHRIVRAESHWLRTEPGAMGELVYNRLRSSGWEAERIRAGMTWGEKWPAYRLRYPVRMGWERTLVGHTGWVNCCVVTPDGRRIVSASYDETLKVWDLESGRELATLVGHTNGVRRCAVTPDGGHIVSYGVTGKWRVWDLESGRLVATFNRFTIPDKAWVLTPDGRGVISASGRDGIEVWSIEDGRTIGTYKGHSDSIQAFASTPDGRHIVSTSRDKTLKVWDTKSGREVATCRGHREAVGACAVTPDGRRIISASDDPTLKVWDLRTGRELATLRGHRSGVCDCKVTPDGRTIISASWDGTVKAWDLDSGHELATFEGHSGTVTACTVTPDGRRVVSASWDTTLKVWELDRGKEAAPAPANTARARGCVAMPNGHHVLRWSDERVPKVWDPERGHDIATFASLPGWPASHSMMPDGRRIVCRSETEALQVWDLENGCALVTLQGHNDHINAYDVTPDGRRVVSASGDKTLKVWDSKNGRELAPLQGHTESVGACAVTPDGRRVISGSWDKTLKVWGLESGRELATLQGHIRYVQACVVTPEGHRIVSASWDRTLKVWDIESGLEVATLEGHTDVVWGCAIAASWGCIVSWSKDRTLKVWDLATTRCLATLHSPYVFDHIAIADNFLCAIDGMGNLWVLETPWSTPQRTPTTAPVKLFYSYSREDEVFCKELEKHLALLERQGLIEGWHDRKIGPGAERDAAIDENLEKADVILLLVSADFIASDYCFDNEMKRAMERHDNKEAVVVPIIVRPCDWRNAPFAKIQGLPGGAKPVTQWPDRDEAWTDVATKLRGLIADLRARR